MGVPLARGVMLLLATLAVAWLSLSYQGVRQLEQGRELIEAFADRTIPTAGMQAAVDDLETGRRFSADNDFLITEAALRWAAGQRDEARMLAREATERERDNVAAWFFAYAVSRDPSQRRVIRRQIVRLNPRAADLF